MRGEYANEIVDAEGEAGDVLDAGDTLDARTPHYLS